MTECCDLCIVVDMTFADKAFIVDRECHVASDTRQLPFGTFGCSRWRAFDHGDVLANSLFVKAGSYVELVAHARARWLPQIHVLRGVRCEIRRRYSTAG
jgi:hypothetical protein